MHKVSYLIWCFILLYKLLSNNSVYICGQIVKKSHARSVRFLRRRTRALLDNVVGRVVIYGIDTATGAAEWTLKHLEPSPGTGAHPRGSVGRETSEKHVQTDITKMMKSTETKGQQTALSGSDYTWADRVRHSPNCAVNSLISKNPCAEWYCVGLLTGRCCWRIISVCTFYGNKIDDVLERPVLVSRMDSAYKKTLVVGFSEDVCE